MAISQLSVQSRLVVPTWEGKSIGSATGFVVVHDSRPYLITNWHVVSGLNPDTGEFLSSHGVVPDGLVIRHFMSPAGSGPVPMTWMDFPEPIRGIDDVPIWLEHPEYGQKVDVVALPLTNVEGVQLLPYGLEVNAPSVDVRVSDWISIIGFPFGESASGTIAIWTKGSIASEPEVDFNGFPYFMIDARTRQGQSGSPVVFYSNGSSPVPRKDGSISMGLGIFTELIGVYSGRINADSDIGRVWKSRVIKEIIRGGRSGDGEYHP